MVERGFVIRGRVQGVGFRWWTRRTAEALGLLGTVKNLPDGSVEVMARGDEEAVERLANELHAGPPAARVDEVAQVAAKLRSDTVAFTIER